MSEIKKKLLKFGRRLVGAINRRVTKLIPVDDKRIFFIAFHGRGYMDNPKALFEYMYNNEEYKDYDFVWALLDPEDKRYEGVRTVKYLSFKFFWEMARSKYWIINCKMPHFIAKKPNQVYIQTWHGTPLKKLGCDIEVNEETKFYRSGVSMGAMKRSYRKDAKKYTYMISPNKFCTDIFPSAFGCKYRKLIETGYPRNDFITNATKEECDEIKKRLGIPLDKKVILYAPTWRDNAFNDEGYVFELKVDFHKWKEVLGDEYVVIFKPHYLIVTHYDDSEELNGFLYNIDATAEINELYVISDAMVTDYSSVFFDYAILNRPMYFYMYDIEEYAEQLRGFYLDVHTDIPGEIYKDEDGLLTAMKNEDYDFDRLHKFNTRFNHAQDGRCCQKVLDIMFAHEVLS